MANYFFTSDTHFNHSNIIKYCKRPFQTVEEMNEKLIENWNSKIKQNDIVYHLGDFNFGNLNQLEMILKRLNGRKCLIKGNHDEDSILKKVNGFYSIDIYKLVKLNLNNEKLNIIMFHYPIARWDKQFHGAWHIFGHSHGTYDTSTLGKCHDVGVDNNNYYPISLEELKIIMEK